MSESADIETLKCLLARVKSAKEADRGIILDVVKAVLGHPLSPTADGEFFHTLMRLLGAEAWTDAALALVGRCLPGWRRAAMERACCWEGVVEQHFTGRADKGPHRVFAATTATPALALIASLLAALIAEKEAGTEGVES